MKGHGSDQVMLVRFDFVKEFVCRGKSWFLLLSFSTTGNSVVSSFVSMTHEDVSDIEFKHGDQVNAGHSERRQEQPQFTLARNTRTGSP